MPPLMLQQPLLASQPAAVAGQRAILPDHPVTGNHDRHAIGAIGAGHRPHRLRLAECLGLLGIARGAAIPSRLLICCSVKRFFMFVFFSENEHY